MQNSRFHACRGYEGAQQNVCGGKSVQLINVAYNHPIIDIIKVVNQSVAFGKKNINRVDSVYETSKNMRFKKGIFHFKKCFFCHFGHGQWSLSMSV